MDDDDPPAFTVEAVMIALDEDSARDWLDRWRDAPAQLRTLMESDIAVAAVVRARREPRRTSEQRRFREIMGAAGL